MWSVDPNVPLFGAKFTMLFIVCLILFLILIPFNVILLFTRPLSRFRFISKFKPLLDAYQGPYKDNYYYWTGFQLVMRAVLFGISTFDKNINLTVSIMLFRILEGIHGVIRPFKNKYKSCQELLVILNLQVIYTISLYSQDDNILTVVNIMITIAAFQFIFIVTYHIITYACAGVIRSKIQLSRNMLARWITRLHNKLQNQQFELQDNMRNNIFVYMPEATFDCHDYHEPLVGLD